jgi:hypothetical protein
MVEYSIFIRPDLLQQSSAKPATRCCGEVAFGEGPPEV